MGFRVHASSKPPKTLNPEALKPLNPKPLNSKPQTLNPMKPKERAFNDYTRFNVWGLVRWVCIGFLASLGFRISAGKFEKPPFQDHTRNRVIWEASELLHGQLRIQSSVVTQMGVFQKAPGAGRLGRWGLGS